MFRTRIQIDTEQAPCDFNSETVAVSNTRASGGVKYTESRQKGAEQAVARQSDATNSSARAETVNCPPTPKDLRRSRY